MQYSTNYNLNLVEGTDIVNPLVIDKPNYQTIDGAMKSNKDAAVDVATHTKAGTVHAIVRSNTDANTFRFVASAPFTAGDSFTVDGAAVTGLNTAGESLVSNDFVIGASVLCILNSGTLTLNVNKKTTIPATYDADHIVYDNTASGMTATNVQDAVDELAPELKINDPAVKMSISALVFPTPQSGVNYTSNGGYTYYYKKGTRVHVSVSLSGLTAQSNQLIFTLPAGYRPAYSISLICLGNTGDPESIYVGTNGEVRVTTIGTNTYAFADFGFDAFN